MLLNETKSKKSMALELIASGYSKAQAAEKSGVSRATIHRWLNEPEFVSALRSIEAQRTDELARRLSLLDDQIVFAFRDSLSSMDKRLRLRAAEILLTKRLVFIEIREIAERLAALERMANNGRLNN